MKNKLGLAVCALTLSVTALAAATPRTPIVEATYRAFATSMVRTCIQRTDGSKEARAWCVCTTVLATNNLRSVVQEHQLRYEDQIMDYMSDVIPTPSQFNACR